MYFYLIYIIYIIFKYICFTYVKVNMNWPPQPILLP